MKKTEMAAKEKEIKLGRLLRRGVPDLVKRHPADYEARDFRVKCRVCGRWMRYAPTSATPVRRRPAPHAGSCTECPLVRPARWFQCPSMFSAGRGSAVFCTKAKGHEGDHRGSRAQWNARGQKVPLTEKDGMA